MLPPSSKFDRINVEIVNTCNLKCAFCPTVEREKKIMTPSHFAQVIEKIRPYTKEVVLHLLGEPLSHPQMGEILDEAHRHGVPVNVVTNGVLMTGERPRLLLHPVVRQVSFSLQSFESNFPDQDPTVYVRRLVDFAQTAISERPDLYVNFRFWDLTGEGSNDSSHNQIMRHVLSTAMDFDWSEVKVDLKRKKNWRLSGRIYLHFDSRFSWPDMRGPALHENGTCQALKGHIGIHSDGTVVPCCLDHKADIPLGNILEQDIEEILQSPRAVAMRRAFERGVLTESLCKTCGFIERFRPKAAKLKRTSASH